MSRVPPRELWAPLTLIVAAAGLGLSLLGIVAMGVFIIAFAGGFGLWIATTYRYPVEPSRVLLPYLVAVVLFIGHVYEEYVTDFEELMTIISGREVSEAAFLTVAAFCGPAIWILGAILLILRRPVGYYLLSVFIVAMTVAELTHFLFPFLEDGTFHYASGMYTAALPLIPTWYILRIVLQQRQGPSGKRSLRGIAKHQEAHLNH